MNSDTATVYLLKMAKLKLGSCCSVVGCSLRPGTNLLLEIKVFRFPKNKTQRDAWIAAVKREGLDTDFQLEDM